MTIAERTMFMFGTERIRLEVERDHMRADTWKLLIFHVVDGGRPMFFDDPIAVVYMTSEQIGALSSEAREVEEQVSSALISDLWSDMEVTTAYDLMNEGAI